ncbi:MAG: hypothetical protein Tsb0021_03750 [Chlamydiales bacterium]
MENKKRKKSISRPYYDPLKSREHKKAEQLTEEQELENQIQHVKKLHEELEKKLDKLYKESGINHENVMRYLDNPNNFKAGEWDIVQNYRKAYQSQIEAQLSRSFQKKQKQKVLDKKSKSMKGRAAGQRRKWIDMR